MMKTLMKIHRNVYNYKKADFAGLCHALNAVNLSQQLANDNIDDVWQHWKDTFLAMVSHFVPIKRVRGRNPPPWINSSILHKIIQKESVRRKLYTSPTTYLREKCKALRSEVKQLLRNSCERFLEDLKKEAKDKPKRFWTVLRHKDKSRSVRTQMSMTDVGA